MQDGTCSRCDSDQVYMNDKGLISHVPLKVNLHDIWHGQTLPLTTYLCAACGYMEIWLADRDWAPEIVKKAQWKRVEHQPEQYA